MTCERVMERLDDYVDGELSEAEFQEVELHIAACEACQAEERGLRAVMALAAALPQQQQPPRDLWPEIADEIARQRRFARLSPAGRPHLWWAAAGLAAAATLVLAVWLVPRGTSQGKAVAGPVSAPQAVVQPASLGVGLESFHEAEREYQRATAELMAALDTRRASLSPDTSAAIDENLRVIDQALAEIRTALRSDPASGRLGRMLTSTHEKKIETLRRVLKLTT